MQRIKLEGFETSSLTHLSWRVVQGSNLRPMVLETIALPTELTTHADGKFTTLGGRWQESAKATSAAGLACSARQRGAFL